jgi:hypothetical protein
MSNILNRNTGSDSEVRALTPDQINDVSGGLLHSDVVIIGCTTRPPFGGWPPGTVTWNPWIGQPYPQQY